MSANPGTSSNSEAQAQAQAQAQFAAELHAARQQSGGPPHPEVQRLWSQKFVGKKLVEAEAETETETETGGHPTFTRASLPNPSRVIVPGGIYTMDHCVERLNVHIDNDNVVTHVTMG